jgi:MerR family transcriptional regulator, light-induced transcriptional regulator
MYRFYSVKGADDESTFAGSEQRSGSTILVVSRQTGLSMETLRAWERRYGFPTPERRPGSNRRLYSEADVIRLKAICAAIDAGYRIGDAIDKTVPELESMAGIVTESRDSSSAQDSATIASLIDLLARDEIARVEDELRRVATVLGPKRFVAEYAHPFVVEVGAAWAKGQLAIRHEHLATECVTMRLQHLLAGYQDNEGKPHVLLATLPGETHSLGLLMVALYLSVRSAKTRLLGASTPVDQIVEATRVLRAEVVGLTISPTADVKATRKAVAALRRELPEHIPLWLGGGGASHVSVKHPNVHIITSWEAVDSALDAWQSSASATYNQQRRHWLCRGAVNTLTVESTCDRPVE